MKQIVIFQGGGALGAYECGVYQGLVEHGYVDDLAVIAGTSIGAINASVVASHYAETHHGADHLLKFWKEKLCAPTIPLNPFDMGMMHRWNAVLTAFMFGNPGLYTPRLPFLLNLLPPAVWAETYWYDTSAMTQTLRAEFHAYGGPNLPAEPRLMITAVDLKTAETKVFDSAEVAITPKHVVACGSLMPTFPITRIDGTPYADGGLVSNSPLPDVLQTLQHSGLPMEKEYKVYIVDVFSKAARAEPHNSWEVWHRLAELSYSDKTNYDQRAANWVNRYIDLVAMLEKNRDSLPSQVQDELDTVKQQLEKRVTLDITVITRGDIPNEEGENISREIDFSRERIEELIQRGHDDVLSQRAGSQVGTVT